MGWIGDVERVLLWSIFQSIKTWWHRKQLTRLFATIVLGPMVSYLNVMDQLVLAMLGHIRKNFHGRISAYIYLY